AARFVERASNLFERSLRGLLPRFGLAPLRVGFPFPGFGVVFAGFGLSFSRFDVAVALFSVAGSGFTPFVQLPFGGRRHRLGSQPIALVSRNAHELVAASREGGFDLALQLVEGSIERVVNVI